LVTLGTLAVLACSPDSAAYREGRKAELRKDYDTAVIEYEKALQREPENAKYLLGDKLARTKAGIFPLNRGLPLLSAKQPTEAAGEFEGLPKSIPAMRERSRNWPN
jgi:hypothetical protein